VNINFLLGIVRMSQRRCTIDSIRRTVVLFFMSLVLISWLFISTATGDVSEEYQVKAAFLPNFARFVTWPWDNKATPLVFEVVGENPFDTALEPVREQSFKGHKAVVKYLANWKGKDGDLHVLFISRSMKGHIRKILKSLKRSPVLTVSDIKGFALHGGMIEFTEHDGSIHFIINLEAVRKAGLEMNFQLLKLADKVIGK